MASSWGDISNSSEYQNTNPDTQEAIRQRYFTNVVAKDPEVSTLDASSQQALQDKFYKSTIQQEWATNSFSTPEAKRRLALHGVDPDSFDSNRGLFGNENLADAKKELSAVGSGLYKGAANVLGGIHEANVSISNAMGGGNKVSVPGQGYSLPTYNDTDVNSAYNEENKAKQARDTNVSQAEKEHPYVEKAGEIAAESAPYLATTPEIAPIEGASMFTNLGKAALTSTPTAGGTAFLTNDEANPQNKVRSAEMTAILNPAVMTGGAAIVKALNAGVYASQWLVDNFTKAGQEHNVVKNVLKTSYGGDGEQAQAGLENELRDLQGNSPSGVNMPTTALASVKPVAQDTTPEVGSYLKQQELTAQTGLTSDLQSKFPEGNTKGLQDEVNTVLNEAQQGQRNLGAEIQNRTEANSSSNISAQENAKNVGAIRSLGADRDAAYKASLDASNNIKVDTDELGSKLGQLDDVSLLQKYQTRKNNLGVVFDKESNAPLTDKDGKLVLSGTPTLTDVNEVRDRIADDLDNVMQGKSSPRLVTQQDVEDAKDLLKTLNDTRQSTISREATTTPEMAQVLEPSKYANEKYYSYFKENNPVTPTPSPETGEISTKASPDFAQNALGKFNDARNSNDASIAKDSLHNYFNGLSQNEQADAARSLIKLRPTDAADGLEKFFQQKALETGLETAPEVGSTYNPAKAQEYLDSMQGAIKALPQRNQDNIIGQIRLMDRLQQDYTGTQEELKDFYNWAAGKESNAVFDGALKNTDALNSLYSKFSKVTSRSADNKQALDQLLQNKFINNNTITENVPYSKAEGGQSPTFRDVSTIDPKVVNSIVTKKGDAYEVAKKLFGDDINNKSAALDIVTNNAKLLNMLQQDITNVGESIGSKQNKIATEAIQTPLYMTGTRYGLVTSATKSVQATIMPKIVAAQKAVLGNAAYAQDVLNAYKARDFSTLTKLVNNNLTNIAKGATIVSGQLGKGQSNAQNNNTSNSNSSTTKMPDNYRE
jgi:hypothetical protein